MKIIGKNKDKNYQAENTIYLLKSGLRVVHTAKKALKDVSVKIIFLGGTYFEHNLKVPFGTAHFLEHMLCNPNRVLDSRDKMDLYKFGTRKIPSIYTNAYTSHRVLLIEGAAHVKGLEKITNYISWQLDMPLSNLEKEFENEKKIILAELFRMPKIEKDSGYQYAQFAFGKVQPEFSSRIIGTVESINQITVKDLVYVYKRIINSKNCVLTIQTPVGIDISSSVEVIDKSLKKVSTGTPIPKSVKVSPLFNKFDFKFFLNEQSRSILLSFGYFEDVMFTNNYSDYVLNYLFRQMLSHTGFNFFREKENLTYSFDVFLNFRPWRTRNYGFSLSFDPTNYVKVLYKIEEFLQKIIPEFLLSDKFSKWFESTISEYLFPGTSEYNPNYSENIGIKLLTKEFEEFYSVDKSIEIAKNLKKEEFINYVSRILKSYFFKPKVWVSYSENEEGLVKEFYNSNLYKKVLKI